MTIIAFINSKLSSKIKLSLESVISLQKREGYSFSNDRSTNCLIKNNQVTFGLMASVCIEQFNLNLNDEGCVIFSKEQFDNGLCSNWFSFFQELLDGNINDYGCVYELEEMEVHSECIEFLKGYTINNTGDIETDLTRIYNDLKKAGL